MSVDTSLVTQLSSEGYHTLQVPQFSIDLTGGNGSEDHTDFADTYFIPVKCFGYAKQRIAAGREEGFMYLSRQGWQRYYHDIKATFNPNRGTWQEFVNSANKELDEIEAESRKELAKLQALNSVNPTAGRIKKEQEMADYLKRM